MRVFPALSRILNFITTSTSPNSSLVRNADSLVRPWPLSNCVRFYSFSTLTLVAMPPLAASSAASSLARACTRQSLALPRTLAVTQQRRARTSEAAPTSSFDSPFGGSHGGASSASAKMPSFGKYASNRKGHSNQVFSYFMAGGMGLISAVGAKATVQGTFFPCIFPTRIIVEFPSA